MEAILNIIDNLGLTVILTFIFVFILVYYSYSSRHYDYWKKQGVPTETVWPVFGTMKFEHLKKGYQEIDFEGHKKFGRIYGGYEGPDTVLYITDPELIKQVTVKDFPSFIDRRISEGGRKNPYVGKMLSVLQGEEWKVTRAILTPTFTTGKIKQMTAIVDDCINSLVNAVAKESKDGKPVEMKKLFTYFSLDVIASCAFGIKTNALENPDNEFIQKSLALLRFPHCIHFFVINFPKFFTLLQMPFELFGGSPFKYFQDTAGKMLDLRKANKKQQQTRKDFLDLLVEAEQEESENPVTTEEGSKRKKVLTRNVMVSNCMIFLLAGQDTVSSSLAYFTYCIATHAEIQEKLIQEIDDSLVESNGNITLEVAMGLQYLDMVLSEALRLHSPAIRLERECVVDNCKLGNINLKKGSVVVISSYSLHRDKEFYPDPEVFDPERFSPENKATRNPYTYLPFGVGPRSCIAMRFALTEMKLTIVQLLSEFRFKTCSSTDIPLQTLSVGPFAFSPKSVNLEVEKRTDKPVFRNRN